MNNPPNRRPARGNRTVWGVVAVVALMIVGGFMLYNSGGHGPSTTASIGGPGSTVNPR